MKKKHSLLTNLLLVVVIVLLGYYSPSLFRMIRGHFDSKQGEGLVSTNTKNQWHYQFHYLQGQVYGRFKAKTENAQLIYSTNIEQGMVTFELYNAADSLLAIFPAKNTTDTINGFVQGQKYWVKATVEGARGRFDMEMKE
jgi:hypothetical protein